MIAMAILIVSVHIVWLLFVIFGALWTRGRPLWSTFHILALIWGIIVEVGPWQCPLTLAEQYFKSQAGPAASQGSVLLHWLDVIVWPNLPDGFIVVIAVVICVLNLGIYAWRFWKASLSGWKMR